MVFQLVFDRSKTAVIIMDYQNWQLSSFIADIQNELLAKADEVLSQARRKGIYVIYVEVRRGERTPETEIHAAITPQPG